MSQSLLAKLQATPPGYKRAELFDKIEAEHGRGFMKTIRDQLIEMEKAAAKERRPKGKRR